MMTHICLMGDSHVAALKQGWSRIKNDFPQFDIRFFAGIARDWSSVDVEDHKLVPRAQSLREQFERSSQGAGEITGAFDVYILYGLRLAISFPLRLWTHQGVTNWACYPAEVTKIIRETACAGVLAKLRQITAAPVFVVATPHQPAGFCKSSPLLDLETAHRLQANFISACEALAREHAAIFIRQPSITLAPNRVTTRMEFANPSPDPGSEDRRHCNADYGAIALTHILQTISKTHAAAN